MSEKTKNGFLLTVILLVGFLIYTMCVMHVDAKPMGLDGTKIGFASLNVPIHQFLGFNKVFYYLSKGIGVITFVVAGFFAALTVIEMVIRKGIFKADQSLYALCVIYVLVIIAYVLFDKIAINFRPIDMGEGLEPSYPSTHTMLAVVVFVTGAIQLKYRLDESVIKKTVIIVLYALNGLMILFRMLSGVHWFTDILGGVIIGVVFISLYINMLSFINDKKVTDMSE